LDRVLIVAQDLRIRRILVSIYHHSPSKLIVLRNEQDPRLLKRAITKATNKLKATIGLESNGKPKSFPFLKGIEEKRLDFFDLPKAISKICGTIDDEHKYGREVVVDVSSGNKSIAIAMYLASIVKGIEPTYSIDGIYGDPDCSELLLKQVEEEEKEHTYSWAIERVQRFPRLPITFEPIRYDMLETLLKKEMEVNSMTEWVGSASKSAIMKGIRAAKQLRKLGYVTEKTDGRGYRMSETGKSIVFLRHCFRHGQQKERKENKKRQLARGERNRLWR